MRLSSLKVIALSTFVASGTMLAPAFAKDTMVGGAPMYESKDIIQKAVHSKDHTTLVAALKAAGLVNTLEGPGPFTVFAPTNEAFAALPKGTVPTLLKPENKGKLTKILTAHVVPGKISGAQLKAKAMSMGGRYEMKTVSGDTLTAEVKGGKLYIMDESGGMGRGPISDVNQSNGVIHVVNKVLLPK